MHSKKPKKRLTGRLRSSNLKSWAHLRKTSSLILQMEGPASMRCQGLPLSSHNPTGALEPLLFIHIRQHECKFVFFYCRTGSFYCSSVLDAQVRTEVAPKRIKRKLDEAERKEIRENRG